MWRLAPLFQARSSQVFYDFLFRRIQKSSSKRGADGLKDQPLRGAA
jgi:hypothetical protein